MTDNLHIIRTASEMGKWDENGREATALRRDRILKHATFRYLVAIDEVPGIDTETHVREREPEVAPVLASVAHFVRLDPGETRVDERRVARLERQRVDHEMQKRGVAVLGVRVRQRIVRGAERLHERCVDDVQRLGPDLSNCVTLIELLDVLRQPSAGSHAQVALRLPRRCTG